MDKFLLLAIDLDGTIIAPSDNAISQRTLEAVSKAQEQGVAVTIATGRGYKSAHRFARLLNIHRPLICNQGGLIREVNYGKVLLSASIKPEVILEVADVANDQGWAFHFQMNDRAYFPEWVASGDSYEGAFGEVVQISLATFEFFSWPDKFVVCVHPEEATRVTSVLRSRLSGRADILRTYPSLIEGVPCGVSKGDALERLAHHLSIRRDQTMAIGDNDNDVSMLKWAGLGVAVGNASDHAVDVAKWVAPDFDDDGAAVAIERFVLK